MARPARARGGRDELDETRDERQAVGAERRGPRIARLPCERERAHHRDRADRLVFALRAPTRRSRRRAARRSARSRASRPSRAWPPPIRCRAEIATASRVAGRRVRPRMEPRASSAPLARGSRRRQPACRRRTKDRRVGGGPGSRDEMSTSGARSRAPSPLRLDERLHLRRERATLPGRRPGRARAAARRCGRASPRPAGRRRGARSRP